MKTAKYLALIWFAVTMLAVGAWAQAYPDQGRDNRGQGAPNQGGQRQNAPGQGAPDQDQPDQDQQDQTMDQTQGPPAEGAPGEGEATKSEGPAPEVARVSFIHGDVSRSAVTMQNGQPPQLILRWSVVTRSAPGKSRAQRFNWTTPTSCASRQDPGQDR